MKKAMVTGIGLVMVIHMQAQTFSEWFRQDKTQIKYLHRQIVALQALIGDVEAGYSIVQKGTGLIGALKQGDLDQHSGYFTSLKVVKPAILQDRRIAEIRLWRDQIAGLCKVCREEAEQGGWLSVEELQFVRSTLDGFAERGRTNGVLLDRIVGNGYLEMKDEERLDRISDLYGVMKRLLASAVNFEHAVAWVIVYRQQTLDEAGTVRGLYEIK